MTWIVNMKIHAYIQFFAHSRFNVLPSVWLANTLNFRTGEAKYIASITLAVFFMLVIGNSNGAVIATYDFLNRLTSVVYSPAQRIDYVYDAAGNLIEERINGTAGLSVSTQVNIPAGGSVTLSPSQSSYVADNVVTVTATPNAGYTFTGWSGAPGCGVAASCTFTLGATNVAAVANFAVVSNLQPLRVIGFPAAGGTITPAVNPAGYAAGTALSFTATPAPGYVIDYWFGAGCVSFSGPTCAFTMPAHASDVYVRFKQAGSGFLLQYAYGALTHGPTIDAFKAGVLDISPSQDRIPAGTPVTIRMLPAAGFRAVTVRFVVNGVNDSAICAGIQNFFFLPGEIPTCTFTMPAADVALTVFFDTDLDRYSLDAAVSPANGGAVSLTTIPDQNFESVYVTTVPLRKMVAVGVSTTLTAKPAGARSFVRWQNGPCANSTNPVCTFTMPANAVVATPLFSDEPDASCTYAVSSPSLAFPGIGGARVVTVTTQPGCNFNTSVYHVNGASDGIATVSGGAVTFTLPAHTANYGRIGVLRIHAGKEVFSLPFIQAGNSSNSQTAATAVDMGTAGAGDIPIATRTVSFTNGTAAALALNGATTRGPFAIRSHTCTGSLVVGASCNVILEFAPRKGGGATGELLLVANNHTFATPLTGTVLPTRENVAAATARGIVTATTSLDTFEYPDAALINGERRQTPPNQGLWVTSRSLVNPQYLEVKFPVARPVEWLYFFGNTTGDFEFSEPATTLIERFPQATGFAVQYWTGTSWVAVNELSRVDGANAWRRVNFTPVTTDRVRVVLPTLIAGQQFVATELEVWTVASDITPAAFTFTAALDVPISTTVQSGAVTPTGFNAATPISVSGGSYSIGCNSVFTTSAGSLQPGESVCLRHTSAASAGGIVTTTLTIGGVSGAFSSTTLNTIGAPSAVTPSPVAQVLNNVPMSNLVNFAPFTVTSISAPTGIILSGSAGLEVSIGCTGLYTNTPGTINNGQVLCARHTSASTPLTATVSSIRIGPVIVELTSRTGTRVVNGVCGTAHLTAVASAPTANLCATGSASTVTGTGPWNWTCATGRGVAAVCSAPKLALALAGGTSTGAASASPEGRAPQLLNNSSVALPTQLVGGSAGYTVKHTGDFNGDGQADMLLEHADGSTIILLMNGSAVMTSAALIDANTGWVVKRVGDFNGDGKTDVVLQHTDGSVYLGLMNGATLTTGVYLVEAGTPWTFHAIGDFNGDGKADIVLRHTDGTLNLSLMNGVRLISGATLTAAHGWTIQAVGDFNGDGKQDIIFRRTDGTLYLGIMDGTHLTSGTELNFDSHWTVQAVGDFNGDGIADLVLKHTDGRLYIHLMSSTSSGNGDYLSDAGSPWTFQAVGDFNGDGKSDLVLKDATGALYVLLMNGASGVSGAYIAEGSGWTIKRVTDFNGDGKADLVLQHADGSSYIGLMNGTAISNKVSITTSGNP